MSKENITINLQLGAFSPSLKSQLKDFDFVPDEEIKIMSKYKWLYLSDSCILSDGDYIFSGGEWLL